MPPVWQRSRWNQETGLVATQPQEHPRLCFRALLGAFAGMVQHSYLHHTTTIMLLTCRGFATSRPTVHFFPEKRPMPPIFPFLGAARSVRVPTSTVDSLTFLLMLSW